ncbi:hypothetical protein H1S01_04645 [Heliobacterium chlorum]|uniref:Uncharacterized protein n=1 Tax=Heliobacterium chlorum TaxID=2698 RepID=A0ABR7SZ30_HELCL|nr:hypothetical protein [Heliobacterium chlorum]MBC9783800.1 hypothetical protein [Heliobacterium chlorum]
MADKGKTDHGNQAGILHSYVNPILPGTDRLKQEDGVTYKNTSTGAGLERNDKLPE